jgi:L-threonylcarbamoyladenylate synthase
LAVNALNARAVRRLFAIKGRPTQNPVIVHVADRTMAQRCVALWSEAAERLACSFWPGPLTLVLPKATELPAEVTAGGPTVGIRWPAHPFIQAVIQRCGFPLAAPSANLSTQTSPTHADHVERSLRRHIPLIVDGGPCNVGIESTVLDLTVTPPRVLRPGIIHAPALSAVVGEIEPGEAMVFAGVLKSPGLLARHYAPATPVMIAQWKDDRELDRQLRDLLPRSPSVIPASESPPCNVCVVAHTQIPSSALCVRVSVVPHEPTAYARAIYAELHACDMLKTRLIVVEAVPETPEWRGIADRLSRAASRP